MLLLQKKFKGNVKNQTDGQILFFNEDAPAEIFDIPILTKWLKRVIKTEKPKKKLSEINIIFCTDEYLYKMNMEYLNHDTYTDIITFDFSDRRVVQGDLFISWDRTKENAEKFHVEHSNELHRVMVHGVLHLLGYKDATNREQIKMTDAEDRALSMLEGRGFFGGPDYTEFELQLMELKRLAVLKAKEEKKRARKEKRERRDLFPMGGRFTKEAKAKALAEIAKIRKKIEAVNEREKEKLERIMIERRRQFAEAEEKQKLFEEQKRIREEQVRKARIAQALQDAKSREEKDKALLNKLLQESKEKKKS